jgi:parallel beta-helix repeat protein
MVAAPILQQTALVKEMAMLRSTHSRQPRPAARARRRPLPFRPRLEVLEDRRLLSVFLVTNTNNAGAGSLRQAILDANVNPGPDTIEFDIEPGGDQSIALTSPLPTLADPVFIDGTSQPGWFRDPVISVTPGVQNGKPLFDSNGLTMTADGCKVKGLVLANFEEAGIGVYSNNNVIAGDNIGGNAIGVEIANAVTGNVIGGTTVRSRNRIFDNSGDGIYIHERSTGNLVEGNYIGTFDGTKPNPNGGQGVDIAEGAGNNTIGGATAGAGNLISGNSHDGLFIDSGVTGILVQGNEIGTNAAGTAAVGNGDGVLVIGSNNTIGGTAAGAGNLISGNADDGIIFQGDDGNLVQGNTIGTNAAGTAAVANAGYGVILDGSHDTVGGTAAGAGNLISGNGNAGISIDFDANLVQGNRIGTNASGTAALDNGGDGITVSGASNTIGGTAAGAGNLISGNSQDGIFIIGSANLVQGNKIGTNAAGTAALANGTNGIDIQGSNNTIGGTAAGAGNTIAFNTANGVRVESGSGNAIRHNSIFANGGLGIRLDPGANNNQPAPVLTSARYSPFMHVLRVKGTMTGVPGTRVTLEFFANLAGDPEGKVFLGSLVVTIGANGTVSFTFTLHTTAVSKGMLITATATDAANDTSEFSAGQTVM